MNGIRMGNRSLPFVRTGFAEPNLSLPQLLTLVLVLSAMTLPTTTAYSQGNAASPGNPPSPANAVRKTDFQTAASRTTKPVRSDLSPLDASGRVRAAGTISQDFRERTQTTLESIPDNVWRGLWHAGWRVQLSEFVVDAAPNLKGTQPRGWPLGTTWENTDAVHLPDERLLVFAEKRRTRRGNVVPSQRISGVIRHEIGHAFDQASGGPYRYRSSSSSFLVAYHHDVAKLTPQDRAALEYYLQNNQAGRQEAFAEAFGVLFGGGSEQAEGERFEKSFPHVLRYVEQAVREL